MPDKPYSNDDVWRVAALINGPDQHEDEIVARVILDHLTSRGWAKRADVLEEVEHEFRDIPGVGRWARAERDGCV